MSQRVEAVLNASGLRGPALASLEGGSGLFALTDEHLIFHDSHGTRRVTLRDLARIHSDAEGTLRVETPAGVAMSASLIGFDGDAVQRFFSQVRDVTARIKSLTPPPLAPAPTTKRPAPRPAAAPSRPASTQPEPSHAPAPAPSPSAVNTSAASHSVVSPSTVSLSADPPADPDRGVSVTPVRRPDAETQRISGPAPRITVNRGGQREQLAPDTRAPRENGLGLSSTVGSALGRNLPPPGSVEIRAVRHPAPGTPAAPVTQGFGPHVTLLPSPTAPEQDEPAESELSGHEQAHFTPTSAGSESHASEIPAPLPAQPQPQSAPEPLHYTSRDLVTQAGRVRGVPGRLRLLAAVLIVGAVVTALLMFLNAQRLFALWVLIAGVVGAVALLSLAELAQLQTIQAAVLAGPDAEPDAGEAEADPSEPEHEEEPGDPDPQPQNEADPERQG